MQADTLLQVRLPSTAARRVLSGLGSTILYQALMAASSIVLVPLFLRAWGADGYGRWLALTALVSYLSLFDLGGQTFIGNLLAHAYAQGNGTQFRRYLSEGVSLFLVIAFAAFVLLAVVLLVPGLTLPGESQPLTTEERLIILCMGIPILIGIPGGVYVTAYRATGRLARGTMLGNVLRGIGLLGFVTVLLLELSPLAYAIVNLAQGLVLTVVIVWDLVHQVPMCREIELSWTMARAGRIHLTGAFFFWMLTLAYAMNFHGVILVLNATTTATVVTLYATHRTVVGLIGYIGNLLQTPLWPELTFLYAQGRYEDLARIVTLAVKVVSLATTVAALGLWGGLPFIYPLWTGRHLQMDSVLLLILLVQAVVLAGAGTAGWVLLASNQHRRLTWWALGNAALALVLATILAPYWGTIGVAIAVLTGEIVCVFMVYPYLAARLLHITALRLYSAFFQAIGSVLIPVGIAWAVISVFPDLSVLGAAVIAMVLFVPTVYWVLGKEEIGWLGLQLSKSLGWRG